MRFKFLLPYLTAVFIISGIIFVSFAFKANAASQGDVTITVVPENPTPNENTTVTLSSYTYDLNSVLITWSVDGKKGLSGIGQKSFSINAPALGKQTTVTAVLELPDGEISEVATISPSVMVLVWQAYDSYVPPFYEGKAMPSPGSEVKVVALPEIKNGSSLVNPNNMTYSWQEDYNNQQDASGYNKNYFIYTSDLLDSSNNVDATATTLDQKYSAEGNINVSTVAPKIDFYKSDPVLGTIWEQALGDGHQIMGNEIIQAAPYFISPQDIRIPFLTFNWSINNQSVAVPAYSKNLLPIATQAGVSGTSTIGLEIDSSTSITESATKQISVQF